MQLPEEWGHYKANGGKIFDSELFIEQYGVHLTSQCFTSSCGHLMRMKFFLKDDFQNAISSRGVIVIFSVKLVQVFELTFHTILTSTNFEISNSFLMETQTWFPAWSIRNEKNAHILYMDNHRVKTIQTWALGY